MLPDAPSPTADSEPVRSVGGKGVERPGPTGLASLFSRQLAPGGCSSPTPRAHVDGATSPHDWRELAEARRFARWSTIETEAHRGAWERFLSPWPWSWFCTMTFKAAPHPEEADKAWRLWMSKQNRKVYGPRWSQRGGLHWVRATELQKRGAIHFHALIGGTGLFAQRRLSAMDEWGRIQGFARIEEPDSEAAVRAYCAKYVSKDGTIDLGGPLARERRQGFLSDALRQGATHGRS